MTRLMFGLPYAFDREDLEEIPVYVAIRLTLETLPGSWSPIVGLSGFPVM